MQKLRTPPISFDVSTTTTRRHWHSALASRRATSRMAVVLPTPGLPSSSMLRPLVARSAMMAALPAGGVREARGRWALKGRRGGRQREGERGGGGNDMQQRPPPTPAAAAAAATAAAATGAPPGMVLPTRHVRPTTRPARLRMAEMRCSVRLMPARLSPPNSPNCASSGGSVRQRGSGSNAGCSLPAMER